GRPYFDSGNPALGDHSRDQVRAEQLREEILEKLAWINGVQVWVDLIERRDLSSAAVSLPEPSHEDASPAVGVHQPPGLQDVGPAARPVIPPGAGSIERGRVLVNVPRSFYLRAILPGTDHREPTRDELHEMASRTREQILRAVNLVVPDSWTVDVDTIPDDL